MGGQHASDQQNSNQPDGDQQNGGQKKRADKKKRTDKFLALLKRAGDQIFEGNHNDIVIPVMGPTGVGKSTFVNALLNDDQKKMKVGDSLASCTSQLQPVVISMERFGAGGRPGRIIVVDTPGFDDTYVDDSEILRRISVWLAASYNQETKLAGIIYLHDISQTRMLGSMRRNLEMFKKLIGDDALNVAVLGTTKWTLVDSNIALSRQRELESKYWAKMVKAGCTIVAVDEGHTARSIVEGILQQRRNNQVKHILAIQAELVELHKFIPETEAGQALKYSLKEYIEIQRVRAERLAAERGDSAEVEEAYREGSRLLRQLAHSLQGFKIPFSARIKRWLLT